MDSEIEIQITKSWLEAWNRHDLEAILAHYSEDIEFTSPYVEALTGNPEGSLKGKAQLRDYFAKALKAYPKLHFEFLGLFTGVDSLALQYLSVNDRIANEIFWLDGGGLVKKSVVHYANSPYTDFTPELTL